MTLAMLALFAVGFMLPFYLEELPFLGGPRPGLFLTAMPLSLALMAPVEPLVGRSVRLTLAGLGRIGRRMPRSRCDRATGCSKLGLGHNLATDAHWCWPGSVHDTECARINERRAGERTRHILRPARNGSGTGQSLSIAVAGAIFGPWRRRGRSHFDGNKN